MPGPRSVLLVLIAAAIAPVFLIPSAASRDFVVPHFADLTIRKRHSFDNRALTSSIEVLHLKGARSRLEYIFEESGQPRSTHATIMQCDQRRGVQLNPEAKVYSTFPLRNWAETVPHRPAPAEEPQDPVVTITSDAVDTGERRRFGSYLARRIRTTRTVQPSAGAATPASTRETDGWYIDLAGLQCSDSDVEAQLTAVVMVDGRERRERRHYRTRGTARRGYALEETTRFTQREQTHVSREELIELSERPLPTSLFDIPSDYHPALPLVRGGHDMTRPDTMINRLRSYWDELTLAARALLR